jgi:putative FmdB family regulatory protein
MPTYEYACSACGHQLEAQQRMSEDPLVECPQCGEAALRKQLNNAGGFVLKGGGWYKDGYSTAKERSNADDGGGCATGTCPAAE